MAAAGRVSSPWYIAVAGIILVLAIAYLATPKARAQGTGYSCCNGNVNGVEGDCRPTRAYLQDDGTWAALVDGKWVPVPPRVVHKQLAPDGNSHTVVPWPPIFFWSPSAGVASYRPVVGQVKLNWCSQYFW